MKTKKLTTIGLFTAIICILGPISIILPFSPVPVSLGSLGVLLTCLMLGPKNGLLCTAIYLLLGIVGLPVFTGFAGGIGKLLGPTGGYLMGYLFLAYIGGYLAKKWRSRLFLQAAGLLIGMLFCYLFGSLWLAFQAQLDLNAAVWAGVIPYIPFDIAKIYAALLLGRGISARIDHSYTISF